MTKEWCTPISGGIRLIVQVSPNARKSETAGVQGDALKVRLQAQPMEGRANEALVRYLADALSVPKGAVSIAHGHTSKRKIIEISPTILTVEQAKQALLRAYG